MAEGIYSVCGKCHREVHTWSDGKPYYVDSSGEKRYAYHPDPLRNRCVGMTTRTCA